MNIALLKQHLLAHAPEFWAELAAQTMACESFEDLSLLSSWRKKALARQLRRRETKGPVRLALLGGCTLYPLHDLVTHLLECAGFDVEMFVGDYDNYVAEIHDADSALHQFRPGAIVLIPGSLRCRHGGSLTDAREVVDAAAHDVAVQLLDLCGMAHERSGAEVLCANFLLPGRHDLGAYRARSAASDWNFRKRVNLEIGLGAPSFVRVLDLEFIGARLGALAVEDARGWFETKQPGSPALLFALAQEIVRQVLGLRMPPKKVLALDLDNTLWGGVVADDGLEGIEIGDTSPRGEAFKAFQRYCKSLKDRGVLLAVVSKNDHARALEPFLKHPEMVLRSEDFAAFKANWEPKSDNLRLMAAELSLGLDSFVFVDDNPAEIEIVRQFAPEVTAILLDPDPANFVAQLQDCRCFEPHSITAEDFKRSEQYQAEAGRRELLASATDMDAYLASLGMVAAIREFAPVDVPRLSQLINKSNQFNLTTRRRSEAEVKAVMHSPEHAGFSVRLQDKFGDHGLISVVIGEVKGDEMEIDTWLMSCRVLKRQVEEVVLNELARIARERGCTRLRGIYLPTPKNDMVRGLYPSLGFASVLDTPERSEYVLAVEGFSPRATRITVTHHTHEPG